MSAVNRISAAFLYFFRQESAGGILLLLCAVIAMILANSPLAGWYEHLLHMTVPVPGLSMSLLHWINDGLMVIFFFVVGMEIKREFLYGELKSLSATLLPIAAAAGGMIVPALFYSDTPSFTALGAAAVIAAALYLASRKGVHSPLVYLAGGIALWFAFHHAGVHPTVAGVLVGFLTPAGTEETQHEAPLSRWEHALTPWNAFLIMPVFALANAGIPLSADSFVHLSSPIGLGIIGGLFLGKPLGICLMVSLFVRTGLARMPEGVLPAHFLGAGVLAGIGFTMSLFLAALSFSSPEDLITAKAAIVTASILSGIVGTLIFRFR